jgi:hypothetical protein
MKWLDLGEMDGKLVWLRIKVATEQLLSQTPPALCYGA